MGETMEHYNIQLTASEYEKWKKVVKTKLVEQELTYKELAGMTGYSQGAVYNNLSGYEKCSKFFVLEVNRRLQINETDYRGGINNSSSDNAGTGEINTAHQSV